VIGGRKEVDILSTTVKAILYPLLLAIYGILGHVLGVATSPGQNSVMIATAIVGGVIMLVDLYWSHSRAANMINSPLGPNIEAMLEATVTKAVAVILAKIPTINKGISPPADPTISPTTASPVNGTVTISPGTTS
jgi:hypothetical protein